jgi:hypothetical protein
MGFNLKADLVSERLDSSVFKCKKAIPNQTGKLNRMLMSLLFRKPKPLARGAHPEFYPSNNRVACFPFVKSAVVHFWKFGKIADFSVITSVRNRLAEWLFCSIQ